MEVPDRQLVGEPVPEIPPPGTGSCVPRPPAVTIDSVYEGLRPRRRRRARARPHLARRPPGAVRLPARRIGVRQEHAAEPRRRARPPDGRAPSTVQRAHDADVPGGGAVPVADRRGNVELALKLQKVGKAERRTRAARSSSLVHLEGFDTKLPHELSGGMRQRVQLARSLAQGVDVLLMDEPFGALDAMTRDILHDELERLWQEQGLTIMFVTHNVREAVRLGDRVVLLSSRPGRVVEDYTIEIPRPRRIESPRGRRPGRRDHRPAPGGGAPPWRLTSTPTPARSSSTPSSPGSTSSRWSCPPKQSRAVAPLGGDVAQGPRGRDRARVLAVPRLDRVEARVRAPAAAEAFQALWDNRERRVGSGAHHVVDRASAATCSRCSSARHRRARRPQPDRFAPPSAR